jgi:hypothetical protein
MRLIARDGSLRETGRFWIHTILIRKYRFASYPSFSSAFHDFILRESTMFSPHGLYVPFSDDTYSHQREHVLRPLCRRFNCRPMTALYSMTVNFLTQLEFNVARCWSMFSHMSPVYDEWQKTHRKIEKY